MSNPLRDSIFRLVILLALMPIGIPCFVLGFICLCAVAGLRAGWQKAESFIERYSDV